MPPRVSEPNGRNTSQKTAAHFARNKTSLATYVAVTSRLDDGALMAAKQIVLSLG
jgi:hypothetical protein